MTIREQWSAWVRELKEKCEVNNVDLAAITGTTRQAVRKWAAGEATPSEECQAKLIDFAKSRGLIA